nr:hypothetical protein [Tanacetum cinerariifolium]
MAQENYVEGCSMQRPPLLEPNRFFFYKAHFETYVNSKDIDLWQVILNGDFYYEVEDSETKLMKETPYELLEDDQKKKFGKNNEARITLYNALPRSKTTKEKVKSLALKAKVTREQTSEDSDSQRESNEYIDKEEEAKAFNLFGRGRRNNFGNKGGESLKQKGACYKCGIEGHFKSVCRKPKENKSFVEGAWSDSEDGDERQNDANCLMAIDSQEVVSKPSSFNHDLNIIDLQKENEKLLWFNKDFAKTFEKLLNENFSLKSKNSKLLSKTNDLEFEVKKLVNDKEVVEPCQTYAELTQEVDSLKCNVSRLQDETLNFQNSKESSIALDKSS